LASKKCDEKSRDGRTPRGDHQILTFAKWRLGFDGPWSNDDDWKMVLGNASDETKKKLLSLLFLRYKDRLSQSPVPYYKSQGDHDPDKWRFLEIPVVYE
jgi:hypothetical protein